MLYLYLKNVSRLYLKDIECKEVFIMAAADIFQVLFVKSCFCSVFKVSFSCNFK